MTKANAIQVLTCCAALLCTVVCGCGGGSGVANVPSLPLLPAGTHFGIVDEDTAPDGAFSESIAHGQSIYELSPRWSELEASEGVFTLTDFHQQLMTTRAAGLRPYVVVRTIDTNRLSIPSYLLSGPDTFADGHFDANRVITRFSALLDEIVPLIVQHGGFALSVGNEVDVWLRSHPAEELHYVSFLRAAVSHVHALDNRLVVGATFTFDAWEGQPSLIARIVDASDVLIASYYPLLGYQVESPSLVNEHMQTLLGFAGRKYILIQESGYPSSATNGSSLAMQRTFIERLMAETGQQPQIRMVNIVHLADWPAATVDGFLSYYGDSSPAFRSFLATLGLHDDDGVPKPAFTAYLEGLDVYAP